MVCVCDRPCADQGLLPVRSPPLNFTEAELLDGRVYCVSLSLYLKRQRGIGSFFFSFFFYYFYFFARVILVRKNRAQEKKKKKTSKGRGERRRGKVLSHSAVTQRWWTFFFFFFFFFKASTQHGAESRTWSCNLCRSRLLLFIYFIYDTINRWLEGRVILLHCVWKYCEKKKNQCVCVCVFFFSWTRCNPTLLCA